MNFLKRFATWLLLLTVFLASGVVNAKVASGVQNLSGGLHQAETTSNPLWHQAKIGFSYDDASGSPVAPKKLPDNAIVCRGGSCTADRFAGGSGVSVDAAGKLNGVSVNSAAGKSLDELTVGIPHKKVGVTTVGDVRKSGGDVIPSPNVKNPNHATLQGITPQQAQDLMTPTVRNPNAR